MTYTIRFTNSAGEVYEVNNANIDIQMTTIMFDTTVPGLSDPIVVPLGGVGRKISFTWTDPIDPNSPETYRQSLSALSQKLLTFFMTGRIGERFKIEIPDWGIVDTNAWYGAVQTLHIKQKGGELALDVSITFVVGKVI